MNNSALEKKGQVLYVRLSTDFGLKEFNPPADKCLKSRKNGIRRYRRYVYEAGAISRPDKMQAKVIKDNVIAKERKKADWSVFKNNLKLT